MCSDNEFKSNKLIVKLIENQVFLNDSDQTRAKNFALIDARLIKFFIKRDNSSGIYIGHLYNIWIKNMEKKIFCWSRKFSLARAEKFSFARAARVKKKFLLKNMFVSEIYEWPD